MKRIQVFQSFLASTIFKDSLKLLHYKQSKESLHNPLILPLQSVMNDTEINLNAEMIIRN